jgi:hypothetical protein
MCPEALVVVVVVGLRKLSPSLPLGAGCDQLAPKGGATHILAHRGQQGPPDAPSSSLELVALCRHEWAREATPCRHPPRAGRSVPCSIYVGSEVATIPRSDVTSRRGVTPTTPTDCERGTVFQRRWETNPIRLGPTSSTARRPAAYCGMGWCDKIHCDSEARHIVRDGVAAKPPGMVLLAHPLLGTTCSASPPVGTTRSGRCSSLSSGSSNDRRVASPPSLSHFSNFSHSFTILLHSLTHLLLLQGQGAEAAEQGAQAAA